MTRERRPQRTERRRSARKVKASNGKTQRGQFHQITVIKPFCSPCRSILQEVSDKYEIPIYKYREGMSLISIKNFAKRMRIELKSFENLRYGPLAPGFLPMSNWATFEVPMARARWFEDVLNYDGRLVIQKGSLDKKSYARGRRGTIRHAWKDQAGYDGPVGTGGIRSALFAGMEIGQTAAVESSCKSGNDIWKQVKKIKKENSK